MKKSDSVFLLVKSLNKGEKRNFRMISQMTSGDKVYLQLFDALEKQEEYDEEKLLKQFRKDPVFIRQFAYNKNYLYNAILESLVHFDKSNAAQGSSMYLQVKILFEKNLFQQSRKMLRRAKERAMRTEAFLEWMQLLELERRIVRATTDFRMLEGAFTEIEEEERKAMSLQAEVQEYRSLLNQSAVIFYSRPTARHVREEKQINFLTAHPFLQAGYESASVRARLMKLDIRFMMAFYRNETEPSIQIAKESVALSEKHAEMLQSNPYEYMVRLKNLASQLSVSGRFEEADAVADKLGELQLSGLWDKAFHFESYYRTKLVLMMARGNFADTEAIIARIKSALNELKGVLPESSVGFMYYLIARQYMVLGQYREALEWINQFLNMSRNDIRVDVQCVVRIWSLMAHYELGNREFVEYELKSVYRFIYKRERMYKYERSILRTYYRLLSSPSINAEAEAWSQLSEELTAHAQDSFESRVRIVFDFNTWLQARISGVPMHILLTGDQVKK